jgi:transposase-like protein
MICKLWPLQNLRQAVQAVFVEHYTKKKAAKTFGIPRSTLNRSIKLCQIDGGVEKKNAGRQTVLTKERK